MFELIHAIDKQVLLYFKCLELWEKFSTWEFGRSGFFATRHRNCNQATPRSSAVLHTKRRQQNTARKF